MSVVLYFLAATFAAACIWLTVRIVNRRERWAKRTAVALVAALVGYPISFGPACWIGSRTGIGNGALAVVYQPLLRLCMRNTWPGDVSWWYAKIGTKDGIYTSRGPEGEVQLHWEPLRFKINWSMSSGDAHFVGDDQPEK